MHSENIVRKIDTKMLKHMKRNSSNEHILGSMADEMPLFKQLLDTLSNDELDLYTQKYRGFNYFAQLLTGLAQGIARSKRN